jgi:hypothetical protein
MERNFFVLEATTIVRRFFMRHSPAKVCLREKEISETTCDNCVPGCLFFASQPSEENILLAADLEKLVEEMDLKKNVKPFVMFIK